MFPHMLAEKTGSVAVNYQFPMWMWLVAGAVAVALVVADVLVNPTGREPSLDRAGAFVGVSFVAAAGICILVGQQQGLDAASQFIQGFLAEDSLSVDNLMVLSIILSAFGLWRGYHGRVIRWMMVTCIVTRIPILIYGAQFYQRLWWSSPFVLGPLMLWATIKLAKEAFKSEATKFVPDVYQSGKYKFFQRLFRSRLAEDTYGPTFVTRQEGKLMVTLFAVIALVLLLVSLGASGDSIPIIMTISHSSFIILYSNIFSLLALVPLYFVWDALSDRFHLMRFSLVVILAWVTFKMFAGADLHHGILKAIAWPEFEVRPDWINLVVIAGMIAAGIMFSLMFPPAVTHEPITLASDRDPEPVRDSIGV